MTVQTLESRFVGSLLGVAIGDAVGGLFEAQPGYHIQARFGSTKELMDHCPEELWYTDDTQMTIGVAEALIEKGAIEEASLCRAFVTNYDPTRGYGRGARMVLESMEGGHDYERVAEKHFPGGSFGNGAAMRAAPVGLFFHTNYQRLFEQARKSALPTHRHAFGIEGAQLIALAVALAIESDRLDREEFISRLEHFAQADEYRDKLAKLRTIQNTRDLEQFGNGIEAVNSVVTAIASFCLTPDSFDETIANAIMLGGDTDTIAAMAGGVSGAYLGESMLPGRLVNLLEKSPKGGDYIRKLAIDLHHVFARISGIH
jgi:poly(ADP-ribose) glycohydrolase ARH3